jgi:hypothetical protein
MEDQRVPNLEEMDEQEAHRFLTELMSERARGRQDVARHPLLRRALRGARVEGAVGTAGGLRRA